MSSPVSLPACSRPRRTQTPQIKCQIESQIYNVRTYAKHCQILSNEISDHSMSDKILHRSENKCQNICPIESQIICQNVCQIGIEYWTLRTIMIYCRKPSGTYVYMSERTHEVMSEYTSEYYSEYLSDRLLDK